MPENNNNDVIVCFRCNTPLNQEEDRYSVDDSIVCQLCLDEHYFCCEDCDTYRHIDYGNTVRGSERQVCSTCYRENYFYCDGCSERVEEDDYYGDGYCNNCHDNNEDYQDEEEQHLRSPIKSLITNNGQENEKGDFLSNTHTVGLELECLVPDKSTLETLSADLPKSCGLTHDGSISGRGYGVEIVTPKLRGKAGEDYLKSILATLNSLGATVNRSCGFHLHIEVDRQDWVYLRNLLAFYLIFDDVILAMLPRSRRGNNYCKPIKGRLSLEEVGKVSSPEDLDQLWYRIKVLNEEDRQQIADIKGQKYHDTRYLGLNLHSAFYRGTAEIRYHSGTLNYSKIGNWIKLHQAIFSAITYKKHSLYEMLRNNLLEVNQEKKRQNMLDFIMVDSTLKTYVNSRTKELLEINTQ